MTFDSVPELARRVLHLEMELKRNKPSHGTDNAALLKRISALEGKVAQIQAVKPTVPQTYTPKPAAVLPKLADTSLATKVTALDRKVERLKVKESPNAGVWQDWTPTVTFAGGTTDPSSTTLQYARYTRIGKTVIANADYTFGAGGNRTEYKFTLPLTPAKTYGAVTGYESLKTAFTDPTKASLAASGALVTVYVPLQDKAGHVMFTAVYEVA